MTDAKNKVLVNLWLEEGCSQTDGEVTRDWKPINFTIYSDLFQDMICEAIDEWLGENTLPVKTHYELIFQHVREHDGGGALTGEWFEPLHVEACRPTVLHLDD